MKKVNQCSLEVYSEIKKKVIDYISNKNEELQKRYLDADIIDDKSFLWEDEYYIKYKVPFIDVLHYPFVFKNNKTYIDIPSYTSSLNYVFRTYAIRIEDGTFSDQFSADIYMNEIYVPAFQKFMKEINSRKKEIQKNFSEEKRNSIEYYNEIYNRIIFDDSLIYFKEEEIFELFVNLKTLDIVKSQEDFLFELNFSLDIDGFKEIILNIKNKDRSFSKEDLKKINSFARKFINKWKPSAVSILPYRNRYINFENERVFVIVNNEVVFDPQFLLFKGTDNAN